MDSLGLGRGRFGTRILFFVRTLCSFCCPVTCLRCRTACWRERISQDSSPKVKMDRGIRTLSPTPTRVRSTRKEGGGNLYCQMNIPLRRGKEDRVVYVHLTRFLICSVAVRLGQHGGKRTSPNHLKECTLWPRTIQPVRFPPLEAIPLTNKHMKKENEMPLQH